MHQSIQFLVKFVVGLAVGLAQVGLGHHVPFRASPIDFAGGEEEFLGGFRLVVADEIHSPLVQVPGEPTHDNQ